MLAAMRSRVTPGPVLVLSTIVVLTVTLLCHELQAYTQENSDPRVLAVEAYDAGDYLLAAQLWAAAALAEPRSVDAPINAAQSYLQAKDLGLAMLYFRRAQALDPRHPAVQLGLALVRALRVDILDDEPGLLPAIERLTTEIVSTEELAWITATVWSAVFGLIAASAYRPRFKWTAAGCGVAAIVLLALLAARVTSVRAAPPAVLTAFEAMLQSEPGESGVALSRVYAAAEGRVADIRDDWVLITLADGRAGWIRSDEIGLIDGP